jgi:lipid-binding SYLF domain-containing protein
VINISIVKGNKIIRGVVMKRITILSKLLLLILFFTTLLSCSSWDPRKDEQETGKYQKTIDSFLQADPGLKSFFDEAYGYAVFPNVGKGAYIIGGGYGRGMVYEQNRPVGKSSVVKFSVGAQIGGQSFSEILFFKDKETLSAFKEEKFELSAQASAVVIRAGTGTKKAYDKGVAVFILPKGGFMAEASIGGQQFMFEPF